MNAWGRAILFFHYNPHFDFIGFKGGGGESVHLILICCVAIG